MRTRIWNLKSGIWKRRPRVAVRFVVSTVFVLVSIAIVVFAFVPHALAQLNTGLEFGTATGLSTQDIRVSVAKVIRAALGLLGIIALGVVLVGGFLWMTSGGEEEKITRAKRLLGNGAIGLAIILTSFSITQFVLSRLSSALSSSAVQTAAVGEGGGFLPPGALPGGCVDPGGTAPAICSVSPRRASPGAYVSIRGYRFGAYDAARSAVRIGGQATVVATCADAPAWGETTVVVEVPRLEGGREHAVELERSDGVSNATPASLSVEDGAPGPSVACVTPREGPVGTAVAIEGKGFGSAIGIVRFSGNADATPSAWSDRRIGAVVSASAQSGDLVVLQGDRTSNGSPFTVTCAGDAECGGGACVEGQCVAREGGGAGADVGGAGAGAGGAGSAVPPPPPRIREVTPVTGGPGAYVTIRGEHFGSEIGKVTFRRGTEDYEVTPRFPDACRTGWWRDGEVTIRIPAVAGEWGPPIAPEGFTADGAWQLRVHARSGSGLAASNAVGFTVTADRPAPGICRIDPASGPVRTPVRLVGERFGDADGTVRFHDRVAVTPDDRRTDASDPSENYRWSDSEVRGVLAPRAARTGLLRLWRRGDDPDARERNAGSNPVTFEVRDCRTGASCAEGTTCCGDGTCRDRCTAAATAGAYQWTFATGTIPKVPRVVEACDASGFVFSPSPWDRQGAGTEACVNALVQARFTTTMDLDAARAGRAMEVRRCTAGGNAAVGRGGDFESPRALDQWRVVESPAWSGAGDAALASTWIRAGLQRADADGVAHGGRGTIRLEKVVPSVSGEPRTPDLPTDAAVDRHYFAIEAPANLIVDTDGTTFTARVFVKGPNPERNPNVRAGIVVGREGGTEPSRDGFWQQEMREVTLDGTWQELSVRIAFDRGPNRTARGFARLSVTGPPAGAATAPDDVYAVAFDDLAVTREGDPCATWEPAAVGAVTVGDAGGRPPLSRNVVTMSPPRQPDGRRAWDGGAWYEVVLAGDGPNAFKSTSAGSTGPLRLDGDGDGQEGGNYRFRFRTRDAGTACEIRSAIIAPVEATATARGPTFDAFRTQPRDTVSGGLVQLRADGIADPASCFAIDGSTSAWSWTTRESDAGAVGVERSGGRWCREDADCGVTPCTTDRQCPTIDGVQRCEPTGTCRTNACRSNRCAELPNTATTRAVRETPVVQGVPKPALVHATVAADVPQTAAAKVAVRFDRPRVVAVTPSAACTEACTNAHIAAEFTMNLSAETVTPAMPGFPGSTALYRCANENCRRGELTLIPIGVRRCEIGQPACPLAPMVTVLPIGPLASNTSYRVLLRGGDGGLRTAEGAPLDGLNFDTDGDGTPDAFSWAFRTRDGRCGVHRVDVDPNPVAFTAIGERGAVRATPFSAPDRCSAEGQPLDAEVLPWEWVVADASIADFTMVGPDGLTRGLRRTDRVAGPSCTATCLLPGSRRLAGICGNGILERPAEECERMDDDGSPSPTGTFLSWCDPASCLRRGATPLDEGGTCGNGMVDTGEECERVGPDGAPKAGGIFPAWCDSASCRNRGTGIAEGSVCGNGDVGDGEDCDDGNARSGDGCSSRCLAEGAPPAKSPDVPNGVVGRCGDGVVTPEAGESCDLGTEARTKWAEAGCDVDRCLKIGTAATTDGGSCGNAIVQGDRGEECDDGAVGMCAAVSERAGATCRADADCGARGVCEDVQPVSGDGCSAACLLEGAALAYDRPSICGDGAIGTGEACDPGSTIGPPDPVQVVEAIGRGTVDAQGVQRTTATARADTASGVTDVVLQCGFTSDDECRNRATHGVDRIGCCALRPTIASRLPVPGATGICRNAAVTVRFDQPITAPSSESVVLEACADGAACVADADAGWVVVPTTAVIRPSDAGAGRTVSELTIQLRRPLTATTVHRVTLRGRDADQSGQAVSIRTTDGVRLAATTRWTFTSGSQVCVLDRVTVRPASVLLQRREQVTELRAIASSRTPSGEVPIVPVDGYRWEVTWATTAADVALVGESGKVAGDVCTADTECSSRACVQQPDQSRTCAGPTQHATARPATPAKNGEAAAIATARVTENAFGASGVAIRGRARIRSLICENPWPAVPPDAPGTWQPYELPGEHLSVAYCRDFGDRKVCKASADAPEDGTERACAKDDDCRSVGSDRRCHPARMDDLPAFAGAPSIQSRTATLGNGRDELRKEILFLPRGAAYCSGSGERCDPALAGTCPAGEECRSGQDAVGLRLYENERHVGAATWYETQGFTEVTTPVEIDGYRGVRGGRSVYVNYGNLGGGVYTNVAVLSVNDGAVVETRDLFDRLLDGIRFTTDLMEQNDRTCTIVEPARDIVVTAGRCAGGHAMCAVDTDCGTNGTCELDRPAPCTSRLDCRITRRSGEATTIIRGTCAAPKDELIRDVRRIEDLLALRDAVDAASRRDARCAISGKPCAADADCGGDRCAPQSPALATGTYVPGMSVSRWPSWAVELGKVLGVAPSVDPLNAFGGACVADGALAQKFEAATCWSADLGRYVCPTGSFLYQYDRSPSGEAAVRAVLESDITQDEWRPALPSGIDVSGGICRGVGYGVGGRCGDGTVIPGVEECDPPGRNEEERRAAVGGATELRFRTCRQDCRWSDWSAWSSTCGNRRVDAGEQCDAGPTGGAVRVSGGVVPGITLDTQYECSASCTWVGGRCGDSDLQSSYGEQCDGRTNVATRPADSSATRRYACTAVTDTNPCKATGGYCGDRTIQVASGEACDGDETRSCVESVRPVVPLPFRFRIGGDLLVIAQVRDQGGGGGSLRLTLETSNADQDLSGVTRDVIEANVPAGRTIADYNPLGARGASGVYHRIDVLVDGGPVATSVWALASTERQVNQVVINGIAAGERRITLRWSNAWAAPAFGLEANLVIQAVRVAGEQVRRCEAPGPADACTWDGGWGPCTVTGAACGNGRVDPGEQCDDGGAGRCTDDPRKACRQDTECGRGATCDRDADLCTSSCRRNTCGDAAILAPTCVGGPREGEPCASSAQCGAGGACRSEACDQGISNWRQSCAYETDPQCLPNATCAYGRTCNYCVAGTCTVATKQGESRACVTSAVELRATAVSGGTAVSARNDAEGWVEYWYGDARATFPLTLRVPGGDARLTITTSNAPGDLSALTAETVGSDMGNYHPDGPGGTGVHHRVHVRTRSQSGAVTDHGVLWALATSPEQRQVTTLTLGNVPADVTAVELAWENDLILQGRCANTKNPDGTPKRCGQRTPCVPGDTLADRCEGIIDANLRLYAVRVAADQPRLPDGTWGRCSPELRS